MPVRARSDRIGQVARFGAEARVARAALTRTRALQAWCLPDSALGSAIGASHGDYVAALRTFAREEPLNSSDVSPAFLAALAPLKEAGRARL